LNETAGICFSNPMIFEIAEGGITVLKLAEQNPVPLALAMDGCRVHANRES